MAGHVVRSHQADYQDLGFADAAWLTGPSTASKHLTVLSFAIKPGEGVSFHTHPAQDEVVYLLEGSMEQWIEKERYELNAGDFFQAPANVVHASFNTTDRPVRGLAIFGPSLDNETGFDQVDVSEEEPWRSLRR